MVLEVDQAYLAQPKIIALLYYLYAAHYGRKYTCRSNHSRHKAIIISSVFNPCDHKDLRRGYKQPGLL